MFKILAYIKLIFRILAYLNIVFCTVVLLIFTDWDIASMPNYWWLPTSTIISLLQFESVSNYITWVKVKIKQFAVTMAEKIISYTEEEESPESGTYPVAVEEEELHDGHIPYRNIALLFIFAVLATTVYYNWEHVNTENAANIYTNVTGYISNTIIGGIYSYFFGGDGNNGGPDGPNGPDAPVNNIPNEPNQQEAVRNKRPFKFNIKGKLKQGLGIPTTTIPNLDDLPEPRDLPEPPVNAVASGSQPRLRLSAEHLNRHNITIEKKWDNFEFNSSSPTESVSSNDSNVTIKGKK